MALSQSQMQFLMENLEADLLILNLLGTTWASDAYLLGYAF